jgi:hypothetical protein
MLTGSLRRTELELSRGVATVRFATSTTRQGAAALPRRASVVLHDIVANRFPSGGSAVADPLGSASVDEEASEGRPCPQRADPFVDVRVPARCRSPRVPFGGTNSVRAPRRRHRSRGPLRESV